jgi:hypothetical protein
MGLNRLVVVTKWVTTESSEPPVSTKVFESTPLIGMNTYMGGDRARGVEVESVLGIILRMIGIVVLTCA